MSRLRPLMLGLLVLLGSPPGCGYSPNELYPEQYQTVAVVMFENRTAYPRVQMELAEALTKEIEQRTPYKVVDAARAHTAIQGVIRRIDQRQLSRSDEGLPEELEMTMLVDFQWVDQRTGQTLRDRRGFEIVSRYVPTQPVGQPMQTSQHGLAQDLAGQIVSTMQSQDW